MEFRLLSPSPPVPEPKEPSPRTAFTILAAVIGVFAFGLEIEGSHPYVGMIFMALSLIYLAWEMFESKPIVTRYPSSVRALFLFCLSVACIWVSWPHIGDTSSPKTLMPPREEHNPTASESPKESKKPNEVFSLPKIPRQEELHIIFQNSPLFTKRRRALIRGRMNVFYDYLVQLGLNAPRDVPPMGIGSTYGGGFVFPGPVYMDHIRIPMKAIDDPKAPVHAYAGYCFLAMTDSFNVNRPGWMDRRPRASEIFQAYFVSSFFGDRPPRGESAADKWVDALWDIRQQYGQEFADSATAFGLKAFNDFGEEGGNSKLDLDTYFFNSFMAGESVVDDNLKDRNTINIIFNKYGLLPKQRAEP